MNPWYLLAIELFVIFITSRSIFQSLFTILYLLTHNQKISISLISLLFFPGTVVHELSHLFTASLLRVKTHGMEFKPEYEHNRLKMGSVLVSQCDPIRRFLIGIAPFLVGVCVLFAILFFYSHYYGFLSAFRSLQDFLVTILVLFCVFIITNTMFSSKKDMEGVFGLLIVIGIILVVTYFLNLHPEAVFSAALRDAFWQKIAWNMAIFLSVPLGINLLVVFITYPVLKKYTI